MYVARLLQQSRATYHQVLLSRQLLQCHTNTGQQLVAHIELARVLAAVVRLELLVLQVSVPLHVLWQNLLGEAVAEVKGDGVDDYQTNARIVCKYSACR